MNIITFGLILRDECWSFNRLLINKENEILKYECHKNGFVFTFHNHEWTLPIGSLDFSLFYKDSLYLSEQGNVKLAKSIMSTLTARNDQNNLLQLLFLFPLRLMIFLHWPMFVDLSLYLETLVTMPLLEVSLFRLILVDV